MSEPIRLSSGTKKWSEFPEGLRQEILMTEPVVTDELIHACYQNQVLREALLDCHRSLAAGATPNPENEKIVTILLFKELKAHDVPIERGKLFLVHLNQIMDGVIMLAATEGKRSD